MFAAWGRFVYRWRWATLAASALLLAMSVVGLLAGGTPTAGNSARSGLEAARASNLISQQLSSTQTGGSSFLLIFTSKDQSVTDPGFRSEVEAALSPIVNDSRVTTVHTPYDAATPAVAHSFTSKDDHEALVRVDIRSTGNQASADYADLRSRVHPDGQIGRAHV